VVAALQDRQDAVKLQLTVLRDSFAIPPEWSRPRIFGGSGFNKAAFWKSQVEGIPATEVKVAPLAVKPQPKPVPAPRPAAPAPASVPSGSVRDPLRKLILQYAAVNGLLN
jgi:hypothetical protein